MCCHYVCIKYKRVVNARTPNSATQTNIILTRKLNQMDCLNLLLPLMINVKVFVGLIAFLY